MFTNYHDFEFFVCVPKKYFRVNPFYTKHVLKSVDKIFNFKNVVKKSP